MMTLIIRLLSMAIIVTSSTTLSAGQTTVAVAANFTAPMEAIAKIFTANTGHDVRLAFGSSGHLLAQIQNAAPYEVFLSADTDKPARLIADGQAVAASRFTYAVGKLVLWSATPGLTQDGVAVLKAGDFQRLALANPKLAPYGAASIETLKALGVYDALQAKIVQGNNISQTYQFVVTGNAQWGFVALSQVIDEKGNIGQGSSWIVHRELYSPIRQDAVLLQTGVANPAATALLTFLRGPEASAIIARYGYAIPAVR